MTADGTNNADVAARQRMVIDKIIRRYDRTLYKWLCKKLDDPELARDVAQSAYLGIWKYAETHEIENPRALLFKIATNLTAAEYRARQKNRKYLHEPTNPKEDSLLHVADDVPSPEHSTSAKQDLQITLETIATMPHKIQKAFVMSRFENKNYKEIATAMRVSESSVEKYIITAMLRIRKAVKGHSPALRAARAVAARSNPKRSA